MKDIKYTVESISEYITDYLNDVLILDDIDDIKFAIEMALCDLQRLNKLVELHIKYDKVEDLPERINKEK